MIGFDRQEIYYQDKRIIISLWVIIAAACILLLIADPTILYLGILFSVLVLAAFYTFNMPAFIAAAAAGLVTVLLRKIINGNNTWQEWLGLMAMVTLLPLVLQDLLRKIRDQHKKIYLAVIDNETEGNEQNKEINVKEDRIRYLQYRILQYGQIRELADRWIRIKSYDEFLKDVVEKTAQYFDCDRVFLMLDDQQGNPDRVGTPACPPLADLPRHDRQARRTCRVEAYPAAVKDSLTDIYWDYVNQRRENIMVKDVDRDVRFKKNEQIDRPLTGIIICRIGLPQERFGCIRLETTRNDYFTIYDLRLVDTLAELLAGLLKRSNLIFEVEQLARLDALTGLYKRWYFDTRLEKEYLMASRYNYRFGLLLCDLDHFKQINDSFGHATGDLVLSACGQVFKNLIEPYGIHCRYGGEEFLGLLRRVDQTTVRALAENLRRAVAGIDFSNSPLRSPVTVSVGFALFPDDAMDKKTLFELTDRALYQAKHDGRNRCCGKEDIRQ